MSLASPFFHLKDIYVDETGKEYNKILIIEDDAIVALDLSIVLKDMGCKVIGIAHNYSEAIRIMTSNPADILLCDINLQSERNGMDIVNKIYENFFPSVIYLTALSDLNTAKNAIDTNPCGFLLKPYRYSELYAHIQLSIRHAKALHKIQKSQVLDLGFEYQFIINTKTLLHKNNFVKLTKKEHNLLYYLSWHPHNVISFESLEHFIWPDKTISDSTRRTLIYRLHSKLGHSIITIVQNCGYYLTAFPPQNCPILS